MPKAKLDSYDSGYSDACEDVKKYVRGWLELTAGNTNQDPWADTMQMCMYETYRKICDLQGKPRATNLLPEHRIKR